MGCEMVAPPVFLSEQEALAIIKGVAADAGVNFGDRPPKYTATQNNGNRELYNGRENGIVLGDGNIGLDLYDGEKNVAVAYISMNEAEEKYLPGEDGSVMMSSVTSYRPRELAEMTVEDFAQQNGDISVGVFYDPGVSWESEEHKRILDEYYNSEKNWDEKVAQYEADTKQLIEEDLRAQVRDFIEWLQGQGII